MRLLNVQTLEFRDFHGDKIPPYAVTSHRWSDNEATYKNVLKRHNTESVGYKKILNFCNFVYRVCREPKNPQKPIDWIWIDTCCINQNSSAEVSESINSMWRWYSNATHCVAHMKDVRSFTAEGGEEGVLFDFRNSEWFERGWTLQELLAPACVIFVTHNWEIIGRKSAEDHSCTATPNITNSIIAEITGIPQDVLSGFEGRRRIINRETKLAWAANRRTTKEEDVAYCLLGIFDVHMIMIYGEGERNARKRLEREIQNKEREDDLDSGVSIYQQSTPRLGEPDNGQPSNDWDMVLSDEQTKINAASHKFSEASTCNVCKKYMVDPLMTSCNHRFCESCTPYRKEDKLVVLFEPGESVGKAEGDAATQNFSHLHPCPVCGTQAYFWHNSTLAHQLQVTFPTTYTARTAEINSSLGDCEILNISIGNWHELVGPNAHRWTFFVKPSRTDIIDVVYIRLHESFKKDTDNLVRRPPYTIHGQGWGYFAIFVRIVLRSGYQWVCEHAEEGPYGAPNACLKLGWMLDFESHRGRGSKGRASVKFKKERAR